MTGDLCSPTPHVDGKELGLAGDAKRRPARRAAKRSRLPAITFTLLVCCGAITLGVWASNRTSPNSSTEPSSFALANSVATTPIANALASPTGPIQVARFTLYDLGIFPHELRVSNGLIAITIEDLAGGTSVVLLDRETGSGREAVGRVQFANKGRRRGRAEVHLGPGRYQIYAAELPDNRALLIVEP